MTIPPTHIRAAANAIHSAKQEGVSNPYTLAIVALEALPYAELLALWKSVAESGYLQSNETEQCNIAVKQKLKALEGK